MTLTGTRESAHARRAWEATGFPLLENDGTTKYASVLNREHGREGLLPISLFTPTAYDLSKPHDAVMDLEDVWVRDVHVKSVLQYNLGRQGIRVATHILNEIMILAAYKHRATVAYSAARILVGAEVAQETHVSLWDNGQPYNSSDTIEQDFSQDEFGSLSDRNFPATCPGPNQPWPTLIVQNVTSVFGGTLTVASGDHRVDINKSEDSYTFTHSAIEKIEGNLVIAWMPHLSRT